jgi:hypothetical protein
MRWGLVLLGAAFAALSATARARNPQAVPQDAESRCSASRAAVRARFENFLKTNRDCRVDADCGVARAWCPLPCGVVVARRKIRDVDNLAAELVKGLGKECECKYKCGPPAAVACRERVCVERSPEPTKGGPG